MGRKKQNSSSKQSTAVRAKRIIDWVRRDGGFSLPCGHFVGANSKDLELMVELAGSAVIIEVIDALEADHVNCM